jgi:hypothetical protein
MAADRRTSAARIGWFNRRWQAEYVWAVSRWRRFHRQAEEIFREAVRLDPSEPAYQENRESNLITYRRRLLRGLVHGGTLVLTLPVLALMDLD